MTDEEFYSHSCRDGANSHDIGRIDLNCMLAHKSGHGQGFYCIHRGIWIGEERDGSTHHNTVLNDAIELAGYSEGLCLRNVDAGFDST